MLTPGVQTHAIDEQSGQRRDDRIDDREDRDDLPVFVIGEMKFASSTTARPPASKLPIKIIQQRGNEKMLTASHRRPRNTALGELDHGDVAYRVEFRIGIDVVHYANLLRGFAPRHTQIWLRSGPRRLNGR